MCQARLTGDNCQLLIFQLPPQSWGYRYAPSLPFFMQCWRLYQQSFVPVRKASGSSSIKRKYIWHSAGLWQKGRAGKRSLGLTYGGLREMSKAQYIRAGEGEHCVTDSQKITAPGSQGHTDSFFPNSLTHFLVRDDLFHNKLSVFMLQSKCS